MSVKSDASGRRFVETNLELPGTPEEVWQAIATGPGISSWFVPAEVEERDGKPVALKLSFGPGMDISTGVTVWDPPRLLATQAGMPGGPTIANEWRVEAKGGGACVLRIVQSLFASTDEWDAQLESAKGGLASFLRVLRIYLTHFRGQRSAMMKWMVPAAETEAEAWEMLTSALGLKGVDVGQQGSAPEGVPELSGVVEYLTQNPFDAVIRLDRPGPGVAALGAVSFGGPSMVGLNFYLYGDHAAGTVARETPHWDAWFERTFPPPAEARAD